jgi:hypothetical protein
MIFDDEKVFKILNFFKINILYKLEISNDILVLLW